MKTGLEGRLLIAVLGTAVLLIGSGACFFYFGVPLWKTFEARRWTRSPATVIASTVRSGWVHSHEASIPVYCADIVHAYEVNGQKYRSNTYNLTDMRTPSYYGHRNVVRRFPPGSRVNCLVNPSDRFDAVLTRHLSVSLWFALWPVIVAALGLSGIVASFMKRDFTIGKGRPWGMAGLGIATAFAVHGLILTASDLRWDLKAGTKEWPEIVAIAVLGAVALVLFVLAVRLILRAASLTVPSRVSLIR